mmetsp:Transcript_13200/g.32909  ORF Transcript_13200/g.32909 Transcript_13200/m.32909 type:complete len:222 (+) Transcript_13200:1105-1770(+)
MLLPPPPLAVSPSDLRLSDDPPGAGRRPARFSLLRLLTICMPFPFDWCPVRTSRSMPVIGCLGSSCTLDTRPSASVDETYSEMSSRLPRRGSCGAVLSSSWSTLASRLRWRFGEEMALTGVVVVVVVVSSTGGGGDSDCCCSRGALSVVVMVVMMMAVARGGGQRNEKEKGKGFYVPIMSAQFPRSHASPEAARREAPSANTFFLWVGQSCFVMLCCVNCN